MTVPKIRNAAAMDVDISVWLHIEVLIWQCVGQLFLFSNAARRLVMRFLLRVCITEKPGVCPSKTLRIRGVCAELCSHDGDCPNDEKCCSNGCGHQCMAVYKGMLY